MNSIPEDLERFGLIDEIIPEPAGGAHNDHLSAAKRVAAVLEGQLEELKDSDPEKLLELRYQKFRAMGVFGE